MQLILRSVMDKSPGLPHLRQRAAVSNFAASANSAGHQLKKPDKIHSSSGLQPSSPFIYLRLIYLRRETSVADLPSSVFMMLFAISKCSVAVVLHFSSFSRLSAETYLTRTSSAMIVF